MKTIKYTMTPEEYWQMEIYGLENYNKEFQSQYLEEAKKRLLEYMIGKIKFEQMSDTDKRNIK